MSTFSEMVIAEASNIHATCDNGTGRRKPVAIVSPFHRYSPRCITYSMQLHGRTQPAYRASASATTCSASSTARPASSSAKSPPSPCSTATLAVSASHTHIQGDPSGSLLGRLKFGEFFQACGLLLQLPYFHIIRLWNNPNLNKHNPTI